MRSGTEKTVRRNEYGEIVAVIERPLTRLEELVMSLYCEIEAKARVPEVGALEAAVVTIGPIPWWADPEDVVEQLRARAAADAVLWKTVSWKHLTINAFAGDEDDPPRVEEIRIRGL